MKGVKSRRAFNESQLASGNVHSPHPAYEICGWSLCGNHTRNNKLYKFNKLRVILFSALDHISGLQVPTPHKRVESTPRLLIGLHSHVDDQRPNRLRARTVQLNEPHGDEGTPIQCVRWGKWLKATNPGRENLHNGGAVVSSQSSVLSTAYPLVCGTKLWNRRPS
jgi:hypothetical protein